MFKIKLRWAGEINIMFKVFYSWQSDLPSNKTRKFIRDSIDDAIMFAQESEAIDAERDEATAGTTGSPNIVTTLFSKIDECDFFIADISLCYTENKERNKKSPNPNVMMELGYAVKTLGWERVLCICNTDFGEDYPFDIEHNRITRYSLEGKNKEAEKTDLVKILFNNICILKKLPPKAKPGKVNYLVGTYDFDEQIVKQALVPFEIEQREEYHHHNAVLLQEAKKLYNEIVVLSSKVTATPQEETDALSDDISDSNDHNTLGETVKLLQPIERPVVLHDTESDAERITRWLNVEVPNNFFDLGNLRKSVSRINILNSAPQIKGSNEEIEKHNKLTRLISILCQMDIRSNYLKTFDGMNFIPLAIQNCSTIQDENIRVVVTVKTGGIIEPDEHLICGELDGIQGHICRDDDDDSDVGVICELFGLPCDEIIRTEESAFDINQFTPKLPRVFDTGKTEEDYACELKEFIATSNGQGYYEFDIQNMRPNECKWLSCGMLIKPIDGKIEINYQIYSAYSAGNISGTLKYTEEHE